jgi:hypothetical protein
MEVANTLSFCEMTTITAVKIIIQVPVLKDIFVVKMMPRQE